MGAGPAMVLVHGYLGGSSQWDAQLQFLSPHFEVIAVDLAGYGNGQHLTAPTELAAHAQAVLATLDQLGVDGFHLLGHSMGGMVAQEIVNLAPARVRKLVLYGTGPQGSIPGRFETMARSRERLAQDGLESTARRICATWLLDNEASPAFESLAALAARDRLSAIQQPTLVVWGERDRSYGWSQIEQLWRTIPRASLAVLPACSHALHLERTALFHTLVLEFLLSDESAARP
jgi:2-hydroxy-6-oxonona-2,4-dienedioate hydrolase